MITNLEERKSNLLNQIGKLKREVDILKWPEYKELALLHCAGSIKFLSLDRLHGSPRNQVVWEVCTLAPRRSILV